MVARSNKLERNAFEINALQTMIFDFLDLLLALWLPQEWGKMLNRRLGLGGDNPSGTYLIVSGLIAQLIAYLSLGAIGWFVWSAIRYSHPDLDLPPAVQLRDDTIRYRGHRQLTPVFASAEPFL